MTEKLTETQVEGLKLHHGTLLAEYNQLRDHIGMLRNVQSQLDHVGLAGLGLAVPLIVFVFEQNIADISAILLLPILFFAVAFTQIRHERHVFNQAFFVDQVLRSRINEILQELEQRKVSVLEYERNLTLTFPVNSLLAHWVGVASQSLISMVAGCGMLLLYVFLRPPVNVQWSLFAIVLFIVDVLCFFACLVLAFYVARIRYTALQVHYQNRPKVVFKKQSSK